MTGEHLQIAVESFGFKHGMPIDADIVMDVRFLPNPHWDEALRPLTGPRSRGARLRARTGRHASEFLDHFEGLLAPLLPAYQNEGKSYLTVAIGCTGGRHRSVAVAEEIAGRLRARGFSRADGPPRHRPFLSRSDHRGPRKRAGHPRLGRVGGVSTPSGFAGERTSSTMTVRVGINGFGRIGRNFFRAAKQRGVPTSTSSR